MENTNILDLDYTVYIQVQQILNNSSTLQSFLEVLPPDCSCENVLLSMELESKKYNVTPAKVLLTFLGSKGFGILNLIEWFQAIGLEKALVLLKKEEALRIVVQPEEEVIVNEGGEIILTCVAASYPLPEYQWYKDDVELLLQAESKLIIKCASIKDSGQYTCLVTKWNSEANAYDCQYSNFCSVQVRSSDMKLSPPFYQRFMSAGPNIEKNAVNQPCSVEDCIKITKHPLVDGKIAQGMSLCLVCEAESITPTNYLWIKNGKPLPGETSSHLILKHLYPDPDTGDRKWQFQCEVSNEHDRALSNIAVVELAEVNDSTPFVAQQKYAFMIANDTYDHLQHLKKPAADVKDLASMLSSMGFKIFAFRNLTLTEMRNAFNHFCKMLVPGCYALFFFAGHGFDLCGQTYLQPIDSSYNHLQHESVCSEYILQCLQEKKPVLNILLIDACRKLPPNLSESSLCQHHGKIFEARMKNNTIYGYSTSFLYSSHENDQESNSVFVKHLKKHISQNKCIQDILITVQNEFAKEPLTRNVQFPVIKSTLAEKRKLNDPIQDPAAANMQVDIINWCDVKRDVISKFFVLSKLKTTIQVEFHHHMGTFCNGVDAYVFLIMEPNAVMYILQDIEINITFKSPALSMVPENAVALRDVKLLVGKQNFLLKKELSNVQNINTSCLEGDVLLKFMSKNVVQPMHFSIDVAKVVDLQLSINRLQCDNVENSNYAVVKNLTK